MIILLIKPIDEEFTKKCIQHYLINKLIFAVGCKTCQGES